MTISHLALRRAVIDTARAMNETGLTQGTSGNVSARLQSLKSKQNKVLSFLITPTATRYQDLKPEQIIEMRGDTAFANPPFLPGKPSSEWRFHFDIYAARPEVAAVVHTHSRYATALACQRRDIPPFHYMVAMAGGHDIRCSAYATYGTPALSAHVLAALAGRKACLLANHGVVATGASLAAAFALAREVENLAAIYVAASVGQEPILLSEAEMAEVAAKFATYKPGP